MECIARMASQMILEREKGKKPTARTDTQRITRRENTKGYSNYIFKKMTTFSYYFSIMIGCKWSKFPNLKIQSDWMNGKNKIS